MVPEFDQAVFALQEGELTGPVKTQFGYHLIRMNKKNEATPISYADIREELYQQLTTIPSGAVNFLDLVFSEIKVLCS